MRGRQFSILIFMADTLWLDWSSRNETPPPGIQSRPGWWVNNPTPREVKAINAYVRDGFLAGMEATS